MHGQTKIKFVGKVTNTHIYPTSCPHPVSMDVQQQLYQMPSLSAPPFADKISRHGGCALLNAASSAIYRPNKEPGVVPQMRHTARERKTDNSLSLSYSHVAVCHFSTYTPEKYQWRKKTVCKGATLCKNLPATSFSEDVIQLIVLRPWDAVLQPLWRLTSTWIAQLVHYCNYCKGLLLDRDRCASLPSKTTVPSALPSHLI